jgi:hypothetical protein
VGVHWICSWAEAKERSERSTRVEEMGRIVVSGGMKRVTGVMKQKADEAKHNGRRKNKRKDVGGAEMTYYVID